MVLFLCKLASSLALQKNCLIFPPASAVNLEGELFKDLMKGYNKNVRPMEKSGDITQVDIKMTLTNLISLVSRFVDFILISVFLGFFGFTSRINNIQLKTSFHRMKRRRS